MPYATNHGLRIHYRVEGAGPPLVLQHGYTWHMGGWATSGYVEPLKFHYQLILLDARGHGASDEDAMPAVWRRGGQRHSADARVRSAHAERHLCIVPRPESSRGLLAGCCRAPRR